MSKIVDILNKYNQFSAQDMTALDVFFAGLGTDQRTLRAQSSSRGQGYIINTGNVEITWEAGISLFHPQTGYQSIWLDPDGDALFGWQVTKPADTALAIFSNEQTYNGDTYGKGDLLIGDPDKSNVWWDWSAGELYFRYGDTVGVTLDSTGIVAVLGKIGGWNIGSTTLYDDNSSIVLDSANEKITVGAGSTGVVIDGSAESIASKDWVRGETGWIIEGDGKAEFFDVSIRGSLKTAVLEKGNVVAVGTTISVTKGAGTLLTDVYFDGGTETATLKGDEKGNATWVVNDWIYMAELNQTTGNFNSGYYEITSSSDNGDGTFAVGLRPLAGVADYARYYAGCAFANFGNTGDGAVDIEAGDYTGITIRYNDGTQLPPPVIYGRFGDLYGMYGAGSNHYFGIGIGKYSDGNYLSYNADGSGTFTVKGGDGGVTYDDTGLSIDVATSDAWATQAGIRWLDGADIRARLWAFDNGTNSVFKIENDQGGTGGSGGMNTTILMHSDAGYLKQGKITLRASSDNVDNSSSLELMNDDAGDDYAQLSTNGWVELLGSGTHVGTGGLFVGASGSRPSSLTEGAITTTGNVTVGNTLHVTGSSTPSSGVGIEMYWNGSVSRILSYNRTAGTYERLDFIANAFLFLESNTGTALITIDNGDIWTQDFTNYSSSTTVGWSSLSTKKIYYKTIGDWVFVQFELYGNSNNATTTFTVPYSNNGSIQAEGVMRGDDTAGAAQFGMCILPTSSNVVTLYRNPALTAWNNSGVKWASGQFWYQRA